MAFTKVVGAGIHTLSNIASHNINSSGIITATKFVGPMENGSGISTFYDLRVTNNLTVDGTTTTLDTTLIGVDRVEVGANSNSIVGIAVTQSGTADIVRLYDGASQVVTVDDTGNVGIGTQIPQTKLHIRQGIDDNTDGIRLSRSNYAASYSQYIDTNARFNIGYANPSTADPDPQITLDQNGNVGINTSVPSTAQYLTIDGESNYKAGILFKQAGVNQYRVMSEGGTGHIYHDAYADGGDFIFRTNAAAGADEKLRITEEGKIGIGTDNPSHELDIESVSPTIELKDSDNNYTFQLTQSGSATYVDFDTTGGGSSSLRIRNNGDEKLRVTADGKVGINTTVTAATKLQVQSDGTSTTVGGNIVARFQSNGSGRDATIQLSDNVANSATISMLSSALIFEQSGTESLRITSGGVISMRRGVTPLSGTGNAFSFNLYRDAGTGYGYIDAVTGTTNTAGVKIRGYSNTVYTNAFDHYAGVTKLAAGTIADRITLGSRELTVNTHSYPETTEYLAVFKAGVANGNRFKNRYIKIRNNYTGSVHGGVPIVWEANADGSNNKAYGAVVTEGNGDIRFLNAAATSEKAIGTDLLSTISEKLRITSGGRVLIGTTSPLSFNGAGGNHNLVVAGDSNDTDITDNYNAAITISNKDGTANNTAGLHFAREDTDGNPHYDGASVVAQFKETMNTGQYPKADLVFLTSSSNNAAPSEKLRINSSGQVSLGNNPTVASDAALHIELDGAREYLRLNADAGNNNAYIEIQADDNRRKAIIFKSGGTRRGVIGVGDSDEASATSLFFSASSNIAGNSPHMVIASNGRVGMGDRTSTPDENLHVHTSSGQANIHVEGATDGQIILRSHGGDSVIHLGDASATSAGKILYDHGTDSLQFNTNSSPRLTIASDGAMTLTNAAFDITSSAAYTTHFNYNNAGTHYISMANGGATYFRGSNNGITALTVNGGGGITVNGSISDGTYNYVYPNNYASASNKARFMAPVNYASGVYWPGDNGSPVATLGSANDTNTGGNFGSNGAASENNLGYADHPGLVPCSAVWRAQNNDSSSNGDGGWNKTINGLPGDDWGYLSTVMVRRVGSDTNGQFYHGCSGSHTLYQNGSTQTNPYFHSYFISTLPQDIWCLSIGVITGNAAGDNGDASTNTMVGTFRLDTGQKLNNGDWFRMKDGSTTQTHRVYLYYSTSSSAHLQFRQTGFYVMDGSEPSIAELSHGRLCFKAGTGVVPVEDA